MHAVDKSGPITDACPACGRGDSLGKPYVGFDGRYYKTCFGLNRPQHPGRKFTYDVETGQELQSKTPASSRFNELFSMGKPVSIRDFQADYLYERCQVIRVLAKDIGNVFGADGGYCSWANGHEAEGWIIAALPFYAGVDVVGMQLRAFNPKTSDGPNTHEFIRNVGQEGIYVPGFKGSNPVAVVIHEGPWGAIAANHDAHEYPNHDLISVAAASAHTKPRTIRETMDAIFPGVPRFALFDQDSAGIHAREALKGIAQPILITGAGEGKDYRDLDPALRFERLVDVIKLLLSQMEERRAGVILPDQEELDARLSGFLQTEFGISERFQNRWGQICKFVEAWGGKWMVFDGRCWRMSDVAAEYLAQATIKALLREAKFSQGGIDDDSQ